MVDNFQLEDGQILILQGASGVGKSTIAIEIAKKLSNGKMPNIMSCKLTFEQQYMITKVKQKERNDLSNICDENVNKLKGEIRHAST